MERDLQTADPVEREVALTLAKHGIRYHRDLRHPMTGRVLDFFLIDHDLFVEVKQFHTDRLEQQIAGVTNVLVVQGMPAAKAFGALLEKVHANAFTLGMSHARSIVMGS